MTSIITFLIIISFLIFVHELGHLLAAKWANVKVEVFSIGFGKKLFSFKYGETEYSLSLLPLGGYVKMHGEDAIEEESTTNTKIKIDEDRSYKNLPNYKKQIILFAGPLMNLLIPFIFFPIIHMGGVEMPAFLEKAPVVGYYEDSSKNSLFKENDLILKINNTDVDSWKSLLNKKNEFIENNQTIFIVRDSEVKKINISKDSSNKVIIDKIYPIQDPVVSQVIPGSKAEEIGLMKSDIIKEINGTKIYNWYQISRVLNTKNVYEFSVKIQRGDNIFDKNVIFDSNASRKLLGISPLIELKEEKLGFFSSISRGFHDSLRAIDLIFNGIMSLLSGLFSSESSMGDIKNSLAGPIAIAKYSGAAAEKGINSLFQFMIVISINLGIINLLPIPLLDGGHIFFNSIEMITRRKINQKFLNFANRIGFAALITLMLFAIYNDFVNLVK